MALFLENNIPYKQLENVGISKKDFLDLPVQVLDKILTGQLSPLFRCSIETNNSQDFDFIAKFQFVRENNDVNLKVFPARKEFHSDIPLKASEIETLKSGGVVRKRIVQDDKRVFSYLQLDMDTNNLISANINLIYIPQMIEDYRLSAEEIEQIKSGTPTEINTENGKKYTIGIDLESLKGINIIPGDIENWKLKKLEEWDRLNPNVTGYWQTSENGWQFLKTQKSDIDLGYSTSMRL